MKYLRIKYIRNLLICVVLLVLLVVLLKTLQEKKIDGLLNWIETPQEASDVYIKSNIFTRSGQLFFRYESVYPSKYALNYIATQLNESGWNKCVGDKVDWESYLDISSGSERKVFRASEHWYNNEIGALATIVGTYYSGDLKSPVPNETEQLVVLLIEYKRDLSFERVNFYIECAGKIESKK